MLRSAPPYRWFVFGPTNRLELSDSTFSPFPTPKTVLLSCQVVCPHIGSAVLKGLVSYTAAVSSTQGIPSVWFSSETQGGEAG